MSIADELWEEMMVKQENPFEKVRPPSLGEIQTNKHGAVLMSMDTALVICDKEETRNVFREAVIGDLKAKERHED